MVPSLSSLRTNHHNYAVRKALASWKIQDFNLTKDKSLFSLQATEWKDAATFLMSYVLSFRTKKWLLTLIKCKNLIKSLQNPKSEPKLD